MKKILLILTMTCVLGVEVASADATDLPVLLEMLYQNTLTAGYASVDVYYTIQAAYNTAQQIVQTAQYIQNQVDSLRKRDWNNAQDWLTGIGDATASYQAIRNRLGSVSFYFGGKTYRIEDLIPAESHAERIAVALGALSRSTVRNPNESGMAHASRVKAALENVEGEYRNAELIHGEIKKDIVSISADIVKRADENNKIIDELVREANNGANTQSLIAQLQIIGQMLGQMTRLMGDANTLNANAQLANQAAETERQKTESISEAMTSDSVNLVYPDESELDRQISSSGMSVDDLSGNRRGASGFSPVNQ